MPRPPTRVYLLVNPLGSGGLPLNEALREPEGQLLLSGGGAVAAVHQVTANVQGIVESARECRDNESFELGAEEKHSKTGDQDSNRFTWHIPDGAWCRLIGAGGSEEQAANSGGVLALPSHGDNWAAGHVGDQTRKETLAGEVLVVLHIQ
jgi:hypothetical protein